MKLALGEEVLLQHEATPFFEKRPDSRPGFLMLTSKRLVWFQKVDVHKLLLEVELEEVKAVYSSSESSKRVMLKILTLHSLPVPPPPQVPVREVKEFIFEFSKPGGVSARNSFRSVIQDLQPRLRPNRNKEAEAAEARKRESKSKKRAAQQIQKAGAEAAKRRRRRLAEHTADGQQISAEASLRTSLLMADKDLAALHKALVMAGDISEEEFWQVREEMLQREASGDVGQSTGLSSTINSKVFSSSKAGTDVRLGQDDIHAIMVNFPQVNAAYQRLVPSRMMEKEFWGAFLASEYYKTDSSALQFGAGAGDGSLFLAPTAAVTDVSQSVYALQAKTVLEEIQKSDERNFSVGIKERPVPQDADLQASVLLPGGLGALPEAALEEAGDDETLRVMHKLNRHASLIMNNVDRDAPVTGTELGDLQEKAGDVGEELNIEDSRRYFGGSAAAGREAQARSGAAAAGPVAAVDVEREGAAALASTAAYVASMARTLSSVATGQRVHAEIRRVFESSEHRGQHRVPPAHVGVVQQLHAVTAELLRHFWTAAGTGLADAATLDRMERVTTRLRSLAAEMDGYSQHFAAKDQDVMREVLLPLRDQMARVFERYTKIRALLT